MRLLLILAAVSLSAAAKLDKTYLPPHAQSSGGSGKFLDTPFSGPSYNGLSDEIDQNINGNGFIQNGNYAQNPHAINQHISNFGRPERKQAALERNAAILRQYNQNDGDTYSYAFETENGIYAEESGVAKNGVEAQGGYTYTGDDGQIYSIRYTADQNGFQPQGDHLPTPPPVPEEILKALEQNARDEASGIYDDGSYNEAKYGDNNQYGNNNHGNKDGSNIFGNENVGNRYYDSDDSVITNSALFSDSGFGPGLKTQNGSGKGNGLKTYLPPVRGSANGRNSFGRRPSFNARDGYKY